MSTEKQIESNRINAQKSTGPRTDQGKQRSSQNALKHGLLAQRTVIPGEDPAEFEALVRWFEDTFHPSNAYEASLVRQMADADWRLQRISHLEKAFLSAAVENKLDFQRGLHPNAPEPDKLQVLGEVMLGRVADMTHFCRYEAHQNRRLKGLFDQLIALRDLHGRDRRRFQQEQRQAQREQAAAERNRANPAARQPPWDDEPATEPTRYGITSTESATSDPPGGSDSGEPRS